MLAADPTPVTSAWGFAATLGTSLLASGALLAIVNGMLNRRQTNATADSTNAGMSLQIAKDLREEKAALKAENAALESHKDVLESRLRAQRDLIDVHVSWDRKVAEDLRSRGVDVDPAPPLALPPTTGPVPVFPVQPSPPTA